MHASARPTTPPTRFAVALRWAAFAGLAWYAIFLWQHTYILPGGSDSSGYFNLARMLTEGRALTPIRPIDGVPPAALPLYAYSPLGFSPIGDGSVLTPTYPPGLPLILAAFSSVCGWTTGPNLAYVLHALAGVVLLYLLARQAGVSETGALCGALALAVSPLYLQHAVNAMSDLPAVVWSLAALWLAGRGTWRSAAGAGFAVGVAVLVRPTNALVVVPIALLLGLDWRRWLALGLAGAPAAAFFLAFNHAAYGHAIATGYGDIGALFSREWLGVTLKHYALWLPMAAGPLVVLMLGLPWVARGRGRFVLAHGLWIAGMLAFYAGYFHTHEAWWYLRFVMPAMPSMLVGGLLVAEALARRLPAWGALTTWLALAALCFANGHYWDRKYAIRAAGQGERVYADSVAMARAEVPANTIFVAMQASGVLFYSMPNPVIRWDTLDDKWPLIAAAAAKSQRPIYALLWPFEVEEQGFWKNAPGRWTKVRTHQFVTLYRYDGPAATP